MMLLYLTLFDPNVAERGNVAGTLNNWCGNVLARLLRGCPCRGNVYCVPRCTQRFQKFERVEPHSNRPASNTKSTVALGFRARRVRCFKLPPSERDEFSVVFSLIHFCCFCYDRGNAMGGVEISPGKALDTIVSHSLEESGQHILRVEVGYMSGDGSVKTLRKFYRFHVSNPLVIRETTFHSSNTTCFVAISLSNNGEANRGGLTVCEAEFEASSSLSAEQISPSVQSCETEWLSGARMFDTSGRLEVRQTLKYLFKVFVRSPRANGIAAGDEIGKFRFRWQKACGEMGMMSSTLIHRPPLAPGCNPHDPGATMKGAASSFVVDSRGKGGLSLDVAASARSVHSNLDSGALGQLLQVTVDLINPPRRVELGVPFVVEISVTNHSEQEMALQIQFHLEEMKAVAVCGTSFKNLRYLEARGGSTVVFVSCLPLATGLLTLSGCNIVDLNSGQSFPQPPLAQIIVHEPTADT